MKIYRITGINATNAKIHLHSITDHLLMAYLKDIYRYIHVVLV